MQESYKQCLHCTKKIAGRTDKKFCNNHCRSSYHNLLYGDRTNYMRRVNGLLMRNRKILSDLFEVNRTGAIIPLSELYLKGFSMAYFTHQQKRSKSKLLTYCYEYGYHFIGEDTIKIVLQFNSE